MILFNHIIILITTLGHNNKKNNYTKDDYLVVEIQLK